MTGSRLHTGRYPQITETVDTTDWRGPWRYENGALDRELLPMGYVKDDTTYYYHTDEMGNILQVINSVTGGVVQQTHYYPYGAPFGESTATVLSAKNGSAVSPYKFGGKEEVRVNDYQALDFSARYYYRNLGIFTTPDPCQEDYTHTMPMLYCLANPVNLTDPTGMIVKLSGTEEDKSELLSIIEEMKGSKLFNEVYSVLENSENVYTINFDPAISVGGGKYNQNRKLISLIPGCKDKSGLSLYFVGEETFHAYQDEVGFRKDENIEFEAKTASIFEAVEMGKSCSSLDYMNDMYFYITEHYDAENNYLQLKTLWEFIEKYISLGDNFVKAHLSINNDKPYYTNPVYSTSNRLLEILSKAYGISK